MRLAITRKFFHPVSITWLPAASPLLSLCRMYTERSFTACRLPRLSSVEQAHKSNCITGLPLPGILLPSPTSPLVQETHRRISVQMGMFYGGGGGGWPPSSPTLLKKQPPPG